MGNKQGHGQAGNEATAATAANTDQRPPSGPSGRPPLVATSSSSAPGTSSIAAHKKGKAGHVAQDCDTNVEHVAKVPPNIEPLAPISVSNSDKLGLPSVSTAVTPSSPSSLNKPNDSCDSVDAPDINAFSSIDTPSDLGSGSGSGSGAVITADSVENAIKQRSYRLQELLDSERVYVCDLQHCCQYIQYMRESKEKDDHEIPMPEDLREGKDRMIFGNIEAIYEWHRE